MPRWLWFAPLALLTLLFALWLFRLGWISATITETDVIGRFAQHYLEQAGPGARITDCVGKPANLPELWLLVSCTHPGGHEYTYPVDRMGRWRRPARRTTEDPET